MGMQPRERPVRGNVPPVRVPAALCATPWQRWLERMAAAAELEVRYDAAPYPPRGGSGISSVRRAPDGRVMAAPPNPGRAVRC